MRIFRFRAWNPDTRTMSYSSSNGEFAASNLTVSQYVGLDDINGDKIYEGDIVQAWHEFPRTGGQGEYRNNVVEYDLQADLIVYPEDEMLSGYSTDTNTNIVNVVIQGNKYENPELL